MERSKGKTKDAGFQFGIRKTFKQPFKKVWNFMFSDKGLRIWLGELEEKFEVEQPYRTKKGIYGSFRVFKPFSHIRINWKKKEWENVSTVQIRIIENQDKTTIAIHQEKLKDSSQREQMESYWNIIMDKLSLSLK